MSEDVDAHPGVTQIDEQSSAESGSLSAPSPDAPNDRPRPSTNAPSTTEPEATAPAATASAAAEPAATELSADASAGAELSDHAQVNGQPAPAPGLTADVGEAVFQPHLGSTMPGPSAEADPDIRLAPDLAPAPVQVQVQVTDESAVEPPASAADKVGVPAVPGKPVPSARPVGQPAAGRPGGRPGGPGGRGAGRTGAPTPAISVEPVIERTDPHKWGRIDEAGVVYVYGPTGERPVGNWQAGDVEAGLAHFARRFDDFATEIALLETRLATGSGDPKSTRAHAIELRESVDSLAGIGDLDSAAARLEIVIGAADAAIAGASTARAAARGAAVAAKEALCVEAEQLAESDQWKSTGDRLKEIVDEWRTIKGIDRKTDDALWKRFAKARDAFTRRRGTHFADLDKQRGAAKEAKEVLIARAEALADSTEWGRTAGEYRTLMEEWKASGRAPRDVEDALWDRFRAAQETFFSHRNKTFSDRDQEFETNAAVKERLLAEAEKINPAGGLDAAKEALRSIQDRWEAAGKVPRERIKEFDTRLRAVEDRIRSAEDSQWRRADPETSARIAQFRSRAESYRAQAEKARASGNDRKATEAQAQAVQWEEWLAAAEGAVDR